jgi:glycosyltransferase involved in cell wall biosynthesis
MKPLPISVCLISGPEAPRIRRALDSVADWTAETIVVLNAEVQDGTGQIAAAAGAKVFREPWKGFVGQKNSAAAKARQPWILGLDADEVVSARLHSEIAGAFAKPALLASTAAFSFPRCTLYCGRWIRHGDWYPDRITRLWKQEAARWQGDEPHAYLQVQGTVRRLRGDVLHYSDESIDRQVTKIIPYSDSFVRECLAQGRQAGFWDLAVRPWWRWLRAYVLRAGFLDGWQGYHIAWMGAFHAATRYAKLREAQTRPSPSQPALPPP